jgi:polyhydroxyalkanoate synthesis regulator phasin
MFTCSICEKEHQPWSLAFQERRGGKDVCRECKSMMKQSRAVTSSNKKSQNAIAALENRVWSLEQKQKDLSFAVDVSVKHATDNLDWKEIVSPSVEQLLAEKMSAMEKEMKSMQKQIVKLHSRLRELVGEDQ